MLFYGFLKFKQSCKWNGICNMLDLSSARCTYVMAWCLQHVAAKICKLHGACHILGCGLLTSLEELTYLLHATLAPRLSRTCIERKVSVLAYTKRKEGNNFDIFWQEQGKKGGREGEKEGRQEERDKGLAPECCVHLPIYTRYFQTAACPAQFTNVGFTGCCMASRNVRSLVVSVEASK